MVHIANSAALCIPRFNLVFVQYCSAESAKDFARGKQQCIQAVSDIPSLLKHLDLDPKEYGKDIKALLWNERLPIACYQDLMIKAEFFWKQNRKDKSKLLIHCAKAIQAKSADRYSSSCLMAEMEAEKPGAGWSKYCRCFHVYVDQKGNYTGIPADH